MGVDLYFLHLDLRSIVHRIQAQAQDVVTHEQLITMRNI
jgi:hypothetical protein